MHFENGLKHTRTYGEYFFSHTYPIWQAFFRWYLCLIKKYSTERISTDRAGTASIYKSMHFRMRDYHEVTIGLSRDPNYEAKFEKRVDSRFCASKFSLDPPPTTAEELSEVSRQHLQPLIFSHSSDFIVPPKNWLKFRWTNFCFQCIAESDILTHLVELWTTDCIIR